MSESFFFFFVLVCDSLDCLGRYVAILIISGFLKRITISCHLSFSVSSCAQLVFSTSRILLVPLFALTVFRLALSAQNQPVYTQGCFYASYSWQKLVLSLANTFTNPLCFFCSVRLIYLLLTARSYVPRCLTFPMSSRHTLQ